MFRKKHKECPEWQATPNCYLVGEGVPIAVNEDLDDPPQVADPLLDGGEAFQGFPESKQRLPVMLPEK